MNPDTTPTPKTDAVFWALHTHEDLIAVSRQLERELTEKTNEVARLRAENSQLQKELTKSESERLEIEDINGWIDSEFQIANKRALKLEAEVERFREALELIAAPMRPDGTYNRDRRACELLAKEALNNAQ